MTRQKGLAGIRILDFTWSVAGPTMTRYLGGMGAEVIKVEWPTQGDPMRTAMYRSDTAHKTADNGAFFANLNVGKKSLTINVRDPRGLEVIKDLVRVSDVVTESFSAGVLERWGLGWDVLRELNPEIIYASISGFGHTGRHRAKSTWGPTAQAMSGITAGAGEVGEEPSGWGWSYLDVSAGYFGAIGVLNALRRRQLGEGGARLDMSQVEVGLALAGPALTEHLTTGNPYPTTFPPGNRSIDDSGRAVGYRGDAAPVSDLFRTAEGDDDGFVAVTIDAAHLPAAAELLGAIDASPDTVRLTLMSWTAGRSKYRAADELTEAGIPAAPVQSGRDRVEHDPQLRARGFLRTMDHPLLGEHEVQDLPFRVRDGEPWEFRDVWPLLGAHNEEILGEVLGYSVEVIEALQEGHVLWPEGLPSEIKVGASLW